MRPRIWGAALSILFGLVLVWHLIYTQQLVGAVRTDAAALSRIYARIYRDLIDPRQQSGVEALFDLLREIERLGIPVVVVDAAGNPTAALNLPFAADLNQAAGRQRVLDYAERLDRWNDPIVEQGIGSIHFGVPPVVNRLRWVPWIQATALIAILLGVVWIVRSTMRAERERIWATMARESAHQLGTPLSSLSGWVEILKMPPAERTGVASATTIAREVEADLERLTKVAQRFELIGRKPEMQEVGIGDVLRSIERYFTVRLPRMDRSIDLEVRVAQGLPAVSGVPVLLEWAFENIVKNAVDVLAGRGGHIWVTAESANDRVRVFFRDDGPGVPAELRKHIFESGVSRKKGGWGVGLRLARRIIEETHGGSIVLGRPLEGAEFIVELPTAKGSRDG